MSGEPKKPDCTAARLEEIWARRAKDGGSVTTPVAPGVFLSRMDHEARELLDRAMEEWRAYYAKTRPGVPDDDATWARAGTDRVYLFAYWLFRYSGLIDAHAPADVEWLVGEVERLQCVVTTARAKAHADAVDAINGAIGNAGVSWPLRGVLDWAYWHCIKELGVAFADVEDDEDREWRARNPCPDKHAQGAWDAVAVYGDLRAERDRLQDLVAALVAHPAFGEEAG